MVRVVRVRFSREGAADAMVFCKAGWQTRHWRSERLKGDVQFEIMLEEGKSESCLGEISRLFRDAISKGWLPAVLLGQRIRLVLNAGERGRF